MYEERIPNKTKVIEKRTGKKYTIIDAIETNNRFGYGVYLYQLKEKRTGFGLYESEFNILGSD